MTTDPHTIRPGQNPGNIFPGRFSADVEGDFVVFLIGMRINRPGKIHKWLPISSAFRRMLQALDSHPELGCLGHLDWFGRTTISVQYWRDFESLERFARDSTLPHVEPWRRFNRAVGKSGDVGIWHETYRVDAGGYEAIYANMPIFGMAAATTHLPVSAKGQSSAARIGARTTDTPLLPPY